MADKPMTRAELEAELRRLSQQKSGEDKPSAPSMKPRPSAQSQAVANLFSSGPSTASSAPPPSVKRDPVEERRAANAANPRDPDSEVEWLQRGPNGEEKNLARGAPLEQGYTWIKRIYDKKNPGHYRDLEVNAAKETVETDPGGFNQTRATEQIAANQPALDRAERVADRESREGIAKLQIASQDNATNVHKLVAETNAANQKATQDLAEREMALRVQIKNGDIDVSNAMNQFAKFREELSIENARQSNRLQAAMLGVTQRGQDVVAATSRRQQDIGYGETAMREFGTMAKDIMSRDVSPAELANLNGMIAASLKPGRFSESGFQWKDIPPGAQPRFTPQDAMNAGAAGIKQAQANAPATMPDQIQMPGESSELIEARERIRSAKIPVQERIEMPQSSGSPYATPAAGSGRFGP